METEKEIKYKSTIMEMRNIIKNQERVIELSWTIDVWYVEYKNWYW
jgi:hypothetical protein